MSSSSGFDTNYSSIGDIHLFLNITGASDKEYEFTSGSTGKPMYNWRQFMDYVLYNKTPQRVDTQIEVLANGLNEQNKQGKPDSFSINHNVPFTVYSALQLYPNLSKFKKFADYIGYGKLKDMESKVTLFVPVDNEKFDEYFWNLFNVMWSSSTAVDTLRYHILPYLLLPWQLQDRKLRLRTDLEHRQLDTDWTKGKRQLLNPITCGEFQADWFPKRDWEVNIIGVIYCDNGIVYIIDRPLIYPMGTTGTN